MELTELLANLLPDDEGYDREDNPCTLFLDVPNHVNNAVWHREENIREAAKHIVRTGYIPQAAILIDDGVMLRYSSDDSAEYAFDNMCFAWREEDDE